MECRCGGAGIVGYCMEGCGILLYDRLLYGRLLYGRVLYGMVLYCMVLYGIELYGIEWWAHNVRKLYGMAECCMVG